MKYLLAKVVSDKMQNTAVVVVERFATHPLYRKRIAKSAKYHARNEIGAKIGDEIKMVECRPYAKTVTWKITEIVKKHAST